MQKTSDGKIVAQERYASRLPSIVARQDYLSGILPRIDADGRQNCDRNHRIIMNNIFNNMKILGHLPFFSAISAGVSRRSLRFKICS
jgi:hypothetical protein